MQPGMDEDRGDGTPPAQAKQDWLSWLLSRIAFRAAVRPERTLCLALVLTLLIGPAVIAIAWIAYRPFVAIAVLVIGVALAAGILYLRKGKTASAPVTTGALGRQ